MPVLTYVGTFPAAQGSVLVVYQNIYIYINIYICICVYRDIYTRKAELTYVGALSAAEVTFLAVYHRVDPVAVFFHLCVYYIGFRVRV